MASTKLIYIVDDQADYRYVLQQLFARYLSSYSARFFASGQSLLDELSSSIQKPDLIILDRHMPGMDGYQVLTSLKHQPKLGIIPVVMMSAEATVDEIDQCYEAGVNSFLLKELDFQSTRNKLEAVCSYWLETNLQPSQAY